VRAWHWTLVAQQWEQRLLEIIGDWVNVDRSRQSLMKRHPIDKSIVENVVSSSKSRIDMWIRLIDLAQIEKMAEVGVWKGEFAEATLRACPTVQRYFMIDPWRHLDRWNKPANVDDHAFEEIYDEALRRTEFASERRVVLRGTTREVIDDVPDRSLDLAYIDGDHTLRGVTIDLVACYPTWVETTFAPRSGNIPRDLNQVWCSHSHSTSQKRSEPRSIVCHLTSF